MLNYKKTRDKNLLEFVLHTLLILFFLQLISDFIESIYALELLKLSLDENIVIVLLFFSPLILIFIKEYKKKDLYIIIRIVILISWLLNPFLILQLKMIVSGLGVAFFLLYLPLYLFNTNKHEIETKSLIIALSTCIALVLSITFRTLGSTLDIITNSPYQILAWLFALVALKISRILWANSEEKEFNESEKIINAFSRTKIVFLSIGEMSIFMMLYFTFTSPTVISRWVEVDYLVINIFIVLMTAISALFLVYKPKIIQYFGKNILYIINLVFAVDLGLVILLNQVPFPYDSRGYPVYATSYPFVSILMTLLLILCLPVIFINLFYITRELVKTTNLKDISISFTMSSGLGLLFIFSHVFTTTYDYIPVVGPIFRDKFWIIYLLLALSVIPSIYYINSTKKGFKKLFNKKQSNSISIIIVVVLLTSILGTFTLTPRPTDQFHSSQIRILTYNLQQGCSENGVKNYDGQLKVIREINPDIIGLQESDTARLTGGNSDIVRYLAVNLGYYSYYGPKTVIGTFGVAILSRYPIINAQTFFMYSTGEQTATIRAQIKSDSTTLNIFVTHLGNGGPIIQQKNILSEIEGLNNVILMGDFNFKPFSEQYNITTSQLNDTWITSETKGFHNGFYNVTNRIDHIFVSSNFTITGAYFYPSEASDHPAYWVKMNF
ncbi:MAG: endonuclease/exonuclease/phosphatase family protein [Candidatus Hodarchaeales archaeon]